MKPEWRRILELRSVADTLAIAIDCDMCDPADLPIITELVQQGIIRWIDRTRLPMVAIPINGGIPRIGVNADVYQLTLKGIRLCIANEIHQN